LGRTGREQISAIHAAVNAPTPAPASNSRTRCPSLVLRDAMRRAVAGGVKNWPNIPRRCGSSSAFNCFLALSAFASGSAITALPAGPLARAAALSLPPVDAAQDNRDAYSDSTEMDLLPHLLYQLLAANAIY
jgi:hypothetical protein